MKVLIADDARVMRKILRSALEAAHHPSAQIQEAADGSEAMKAISDPRAGIDLVIADWDLPGLPGAAFLAHLASRAPQGEVPILFCINREQLRFMGGVTRPGKVEFIERPFTDETLMAQVRKLEASIQTQKVRQSSDVIRAIVSTAEAEADLPFLMRLPSHLIEEFLRLAVRERHATGSTILRAGTGVDSLHVITSGQVELSDAPGRAARILGEGECIGEASFLMECPFVGSARARTPVEIALVSRVRLGELIRHQPRMAEYLSSLMARHSKKLAASPPTRVESEIMGNLQSMSFADVIQLLSTARKTGVLGFKDAERSGGIYLEGGEVVHAWTGEATGEEAFYALASWSTARFAFNSVSRKEPHSIRQPTMTLLMEAMRRMDESSRTPIPALPLPPP
jgi:two-component system chemotaxis response regulator CheY